MKHVTLFAVVFLLASTVAPAADLEVQLSVPKTEFIVGEPIRVTGTVSNVSGGPIAFALGGEHGFRTTFEMTSADGTPRRGCPSPPASIEIPGHRLKRVESGWAKTVVRNLGCQDPPGAYVIRFSASSSGPYRSGHPDDPATRNLRAWEGVVKSEEIPIEIVYPTGVDLQAYDRFRGWPLRDRGALIAEYPDSTYAGYAILEGGPWPLDPVSELRRRGRYLNTAEQHPHTRPQMERLEGERLEFSRLRVDMLEAYLLSRPRFVYADFMRLELATRLAYLGRVDEAVKLCEALIGEDAGKKEAVKASALLRYLRDDEHP